MYRKYLLLLLLPWALGSFGQSEIHLDIGAKPHPKDFTLINSGFPVDRDDYEYRPILQADLGYRRYISRSNWFVEGGLSWRHTRIKYERHFNTGWISDPAVPDYIIFTDLYNYGGVEIGGGHRFSFGSGMQGLVLPFGVQGHLPLASKRISESDKSRSEQPMYNDGYFEHGIFYGLYFKPGYEFSFSRSSPWRFSIYAEGDLLIHNKSNLNPKFLVGGGLGVSYRLGEG